MDPATIYAVCNWIFLQAAMLFSRRRGEEMPDGNPGGRGRKRTLGGFIDGSGGGSSADGTDMETQIRSKQKRGQAQVGSSPSGAAGVPREAPTSPRTPLDPPEEDEDGDILHGDVSHFSSLGAADGMRASTNEMDAPPPPMAEAEHESADRNSAPAPSGAVRDDSRDEDEAEAAPDRSIPVPDARDDRRLRLQLNSVPAPVVAQLPAARFASRGERKPHEGELENRQAGDVPPAAGSSRGFLMSAAGGVEAVPGGPACTGQAPGVESKGERKRAENWGPSETQTLIASRVGPSLGGRRTLWKSEWHGISVHIPGRTGKQCQERWETLMRPYKTIKGYCEAHSKGFADVTEQEFRDMKVEDHWRSANWFNMVDEFRGQWPAPGHGSRVPDGAAARALGPLAANDLPRASSHYALPPNSVTAAADREQDQQDREQEQQQQQQQPERPDHHRHASVEPPGTSTSAAAPGLPAAADTDPQQADDNFHFWRQVVSGQVTGVE